MNSTIIALATLILAISSYIPPSIAQNFSSASYQSRLLVASNDQGCIKWGGTFDVPLDSFNLPRKCKLPDGRPICCEAVQETTTPEPFAKPIGSNYYPKPRKEGGGVGGKRDHANNLDVCTLTKVYVSSPQELRDLAMADYISTLSKDHTDIKRTEALLAYVLSKEVLQNSTRWLARVKYHMTTSSMASQDITAEDYEYLSRFEVTKTCGMKVDTWIEWIEPITITARHPFAFSYCRPVKPYLQEGVHPKAGRSNVDYVLLQSGKNLFSQNYDSMSNRRSRYATASAVVASSVSSTAGAADKSGSASSVVATTTGDSSGSNSRRQRYNRNASPKHYLLDAGTSTFDSSLWWFTCAYSQRQIGYDQVFGWEMTLLEPQNYWSRVPMKWKPYWHFYNTPISADITHPDSPLRFLQEMTTREDFVAFKLDIDSPSYEMPIAFSLLQEDNGRLANLIDEFFFELHFRCEIMTSCGWGKKVPAESHGLILDRPYILRFFIDLRKKGIRAHIWP